MCVSHSCAHTRSQLPQYRKLIWHWCSLCSPSSGRSQQPCSYQGAKVKPFDCVVIALHVYLSMLHHHSEYTWIIQLTLSKGPLLFHTIELLRVNASFCHSESLTVEKSLILHSPPPLWQITKWVCWQIEDLLPHSSFLRRWVLTNSFPKEQIPSFTITIIGLRAFLVCHYLLTNMLIVRWVSTKHICSSRGKQLCSQIKYRGMKSESSSNTHTHTHSQKKHKTFNTARLLLIWQEPV